jgi:Domain of unknown function (DUF397)
MSLTDLEARDLQWRKARRSAGNGACVEVAPVNGQIAVRDSMNPGGSRQQYSVRSWQAFIAAIKCERNFE